MDDSGGVGGGEAIGDLRGDVDELADWDRLAVKQRTERFAFEEFADDVLLSGFDAEVIDGNDVGVVEGGDGAGFALEAAAEIGGRPSSRRTLMATSRLRRESRAR